MTSSRWLTFAITAAIATACSIYNDGLDFEGGGVDGSGAGEPSVGGSGSTPGSGGKGSGGTTTGGSGGGDGGSESGGAPGDGGGSSDGGTGGEASGGMAGAESGGGSGGGTGGSTGGNPGCTVEDAPCLLDDLEHPGVASYNHLPFYGTWSRYGQTGVVWEASNPAQMVVERPDDSSEHALHVAASGLDDWGVGVFLTLRGGGWINIGGFSGISFKARTENLETVLHVALADVNSHRPICETTGDGTDCDKHMRSVEAFALTDSWQEVDMDFSTFVDGTVLGDPRSSSLDLTQVYALHFQMDPDGEEVDFYIDDLIIY